jgi:8-oxo-dGTP pyrophosphatase MutT (NUDIX family)
MTPDELAATLVVRPRTALALPGFAESAVLALLIGEVDRIDDARLVFTVRRADLRRHAGQISFPGGRRDPEDRDLEITALRETEEELGVARDRVRLLGMLDDVPVPTRYVITPVVGITASPCALTPQDAEVAVVFDAPLATLRDPAIYRNAGTRTWEGIEYALHEYRVGAHKIWGATARMVHQLLQLTE